MDSGVRIKRGQYKRQLFLVGQCGLCVTSMHVAQTGAYQILDQPLLGPKSPSSHQPPRERVPKRRMRNNACALEEADGPHTLRAVDDLRGQREVARGGLLAQRADCAGGDDGGYAEGLECDARGWRGRRWCLPFLARKAILAPEGREAIVMG